MPRTEWPSLRVLASALTALWLLAISGLAAAAEPETDEQKTLYALGLAMAQTLANLGLTPAELDLVQVGLSDGVLNKPPKADLATYGPKIKPLQQARLAAVADKAKKAGQPYLDKAAAENGAIKGESGWVYVPLTEGAGDSPRKSDAVKLRYSGKLIDGTLFATEEIVTAPVQQTLWCWIEHLQKLKAGSKGKFLCPSSLAYGDEGYPPEVPPGATLIYEVELMEVIRVEIPNPESPRHRRPR